MATGTSDIGRSRYPALGFDEFGFGGFAEEVEGEGRPQQKCGRWAPGVANLLWVVKHEAHEGSWSGRHGTDRKGPAWHGKRQDRPGGQCAIHRGHPLGDEPWRHGENPGLHYLTKTLGGERRLWAGRHELDLLASRGGGGADGMVGREDRESVREHDVGQGTEVSFVVSVFEEKR